MKTTLALLIAGLIFLVTPMLASAHGNRHDNRQNQTKGWVKNDRADHRAHYNRYDDRRHYRYDQRRHHPVKNNLRRELRETRQELHQVKRQIRHKNRRPHYARPHHLSPAVVIGLPHVVFQFDW